MSDAAISLMPINDLLARRFFVPAYQRGYRWTERQVEDLLNDIWEFQQNEPEDKQSFYCLQPLVVKERPDGDWEVVDGQQRLVTIFLILTYLKQILDLLNKSRFTITFETRSDTCGAFLQNIDPSQRDANIDYYHICRAYDFIKTWFEGRDGNHRLRFLQCLLNDDEVGRNVKVIWYDLPETEDPVAAFTRLNVGKIPLTNAELIRALFLRASNFDPATRTLQQLKIAQEWDGIEKALQSDELWYFLHPGPTALSSRIEYIFQLIAREEKGQAALSDDPYNTFHFYHARFSMSGVDAEMAWLAVKQYFMTLDEWFDDRVLYHLIGYLICEGDDLLAIRKAGKDAAKSAFQQILKQRIFNRLIGVGFPPQADRKELKTAIEATVDELEYETDSRKLRSVLLLFNIATLLQNAASNLRFPFESFKKENWDIEHVRSVSSGKPERTGDRQDWLDKVHEYLSESGENEALRHRVRRLRESDELEEEAFDSLYAELLDHFGETDDSDADNSVGNLVLLDRNTNRSYKNAVFPVKRRRVLMLDREGTFVPLCTKNVFLKCYSKKIDNMLFWEDEDRENYREAMVETLLSFFCPEKGSRP